MTSGGCTCGAVRWTAEGEADWSGWCHCRNCQRESGSDRRPFMGFPRDRVTVEGTPRRYAGAEAGDDVGLYFCGTCGTILYGIPGNVPTHMSIYAGTLDDPADFRPQIAIWTCRRWPQAAEPLAEFEAMPPA